MTTTERTDDPDRGIDSLPDALDSSDSKLVYFYLEIAEAATIDELKHALGLKKVTLYSLLRTLVASGLVERSGTTYTSTTSAETRIDR